MNSFAALVSYCQFSDFVYFEMSVAVYFFHFHPLAYHRSFRPRVSDITGCRAENVVPLQTVPISLMAAVGVVGERGRGCQIYSGRSLTFSLPGKTCPCVFGRRRGLANTRHHISYQASSFLLQSKWRRLLSSY